MRLFLILSFMILVTAVYAGVFRLKSGEIVEGELVGEDSRSIVVKIKYGTIRIDKAELQKNEFAPLKKKAAEVKPIRILTEPVIELKPIPDFTSKEYLQGMRRWLDGQIDPKTGLLESFRPTADAYLEKQASTYDQALAGLSYLMLGDAKKAKAILDFYRKKWNGRGFSNFYYTPTGNPGLEGIAHLGPNLWIALLALHYDRITREKQYIGLAEDIVKWAISLPHYRGGAAMSDRDEWRAPWTKVVSTENNIDYYAVLNILEDWTRDAELKRKIQQEKFGVINFLVKTVYNKNSGGIYRGFHEGVVDMECALDTASWLTAAVGLKELRDWRIDVEKLLEFIQKKFMVKDSGIKGFDFTDKRGAFKAKRDSMISVEWTLAVVNVYCLYRNYYYSLANGQKRLGNLIKAAELFKKANIYEHKTIFYSKEMDKTMLRFGPKQDLYAYPYATRSYWLVFYDSPWWRTPKAGADGSPCGSVASTAWRIMAGRFNPLNRNGELE